MPSADLLASVAVRSPHRARRSLAGSALLCAAGIAAWTIAPPHARRHFVDAAFAFVGRTPADGSDSGTPAASPAASPAPDAASTPPSGGAAAAGAQDAARASGSQASDGEGATAAGADEPHAAAQFVGRPLSDWLAEISSAAARGLIVAPEVSGEATASFDAGMGWEERLAALSRIHEFHYDVGDRLIEVWVRPREPAGAAMAEERDDEPEEADAPGRHAHASEVPPPLAGDPAAPPFGPPLQPQRVTRVVRPVHARADDLVAAIAKAARASDAQVAADAGSNAVVVAGPEPAVPEIVRLITALDVPRRRFVLEAEIVEVSRTARTALGVQWSVEGTVGAVVDFPAADAPGETAGVVVATDGAHALRARINALEADGHVRVVSRPRVVALEGRPASIESVRILRVRFPDRTAIVGEADDGALSGDRAVEEIPVGVTLRVEPSMRGDGRIVLRIRAKSSTLGPPQPPDDIPEELSRSVDAEVAVADGETAVLGGLLREGASRSGAGVPVLRSVPVLGLLFGRREREDEGEELVVLVTPRLLPS